MDVKKYEAFARTVELGSLTRAAQALNCTQSAVSHMIRGLEEDVGFTLIVRNRGGVSLTDAGEKLLPFARAVVEADAALKRAAEGLRGEDAGLVRIGTFTSVAVHWLPDMIKRFQSAYPRVEFKLNNGDYHDVAQWIARDACDIAFVASPAEKPCAYVPLVRDRLLAVLPKDHPLARLSAVPVRALAGEAFISLLESSDQDARSALEKAGVTPNVKFTTKDDYAIIAMVESGLGVSIMPELLLGGRTRNVRALPLEPPCARVVAMAITPRGRTNPCALRFAEHIRGWVREHYPAEALS